MTIYIAGPMTGYPDHNRPAFHEAAAAIREVKGMDWPITNPAEVELPDGATWDDYMRIAVGVIAREVTEMVTLPGWECSRGARIEVDLAHALGITVLPLDVYLRGAA